jgi:hypothetical protein
MNNGNHLKSSDLGKNIGLAFKYIQQIFKETSQLMKKMDSLMGKDWIPTYGNRTTKEVTSHLSNPENWLVEASFRIYDSKMESNIKRGITVAYWSKEIEEPILIGGKMDYILDEKTKKPKNHDHWDLWSIWFEEEYEKKITDGSICYIRPGESQLKSYIKEAKVFAVPLVSIQSEDDIKTRVYDLLIEL